MSNQQDIKDRTHFIPHLSAALQMAGFNISTKQAEQIVKIVQLVKEKGGDVSVTQIIECVDSVK